ncbi:hypothetical protein HK103_000160 [Boothiomyces macroporosus]|uniref:Uncharacterized protein n=1 Tax=Boothiomyces macroporosus TaxID=261099 RepID=A0AAD5Y7B7_9FUNG|nr:hypothetical protein HK103_000160 [Boothiomyces macroporosus]
MGFLPEPLEAQELNARHADKFKKSPERVLLDVILVFKDVFSDPQLKEKRKQIKQLFIKRDFKSIFTDPILLPIYAVEYLPGRALCYRDIFVKINELCNFLEKGGDIMVLGGGNGAEVLGISAAMCTFEQPVKLTVQDLSNYGTLDTLVGSIHQTYGLENLSVESLIGDLMDESKVLEYSKIFKQHGLITAMFLLNEILTQSKKSFVLLITNLVKSMKKGSMLLVVDSAGSFSEFEVGASDKSYMLFKLLDAIQGFKCLASFDSVWYRYPKEVEFPLQLSNMRFFLRLYQKI